MSDRPTKKTQKANAEPHPARVQGNQKAQMPEVFYLHFPLRNVIMDSEDYDKKL